MRRAFAACLFVVSTFTLAAAETQLMNAVNFLVDHKELIGREVNAGPCKISSADTLSVFCEVRNPAGQRVGNISLSSESMDRESLRRALMDCAGFRRSRAKHLR